MTLAPQPAPYHPDPMISEISDFIADPVEAASFPQTLLRFRNDRWAAAVGLDHLDDECWIDHFGRFAPLKNNLPSPLALRYHGHQFRNYNPDIGDGRGFLFAQLRDYHGRLLDLGTKGSGQTPYSRFGDGRLTLKGAVREILATEMLEALGVMTSKSFSVVETGEALHRGDEPSPTRSAVLVRLSHGHIRIGSFQRLAALDDRVALRRLTDYVLTTYYREAGGDDGPVRLLAHVARRGAQLAAAYMAAGFVHGVLNTDNINVTGESFDYGPWRFTPMFDPSFTAAYFDESGLYAFGRQADAICWNVIQLGNALVPIADPEPLNKAISEFGVAYQSAIAERFLWRLGLWSNGEDSDLALVRHITMALGRGEVSIDRFFFDWAGGTRRQPSPSDHIYASPDFAAVGDALAAYRSARALDADYWRGESPCSLHIGEVEAIWSRIAEEDDWSSLHQKIEAIRAMGDAMTA